MITNLFSIFDPSTSLFSISWILLLITPAILSTNSWNTTPIFNNITNKLITSLNNEVTFSLNNSENGSHPMILLSFSTIVLINFTALYPQIFSPTSHLTTTLPLSLIFWITLIMFGWTNNTSHILSHLLPQGTPTLLIIFIVTIELVSNLIRPVTLCVRLTANLIAGHLLISLLGNTLTNLPLISDILIIPAPALLTILESAVAFIQAYVFITLITLYTTEIK